MSKIYPVFLITAIESDLTGIALVEDPAIKVDFLKFNEEVISTEMNFSFEEELREIKGPVLIPDKLIGRKSTNSFVKFNKDGIKRSVEIFEKNGFKFNKQHTNELVKINILESYFAEEGNEFNVPEGSWIIRGKVNDDNLWNEIKNGTFNGFSFQGNFVTELVGEYEFSNQKNDKKMSLKEKLIETINSFVFAEGDPIEPSTEQPIEQPKVDKEIVSKDGSSLYFTGEIMVGTELFTKYEEVYSPAYETIYELEGMVVSVEFGKIIKIYKEETKVDEPMVDETKVDETIPAEFAEDVIPSEETKVDEPMVDEPLTKEIVQTMIDEMLVKVTEMIESKIGAVDAKVEEFGNQPLPTEKEKETLTNVENKYSYLQNIKK